MRYVCPRQGEPTKCLVCKPERTHKHRREEWVTDGRVPSCDAHGVRMVPDKEPIP